MLQVSMKERNNFNVIFVMLSLDRRVLAHCWGRVTKKTKYSVNQTAKILKFWQFPVPYPKIKRV